MVGFIGYSTLGGERVHLTPFACLDHVYVNCECKAGLSYKNGMLRDSYAFFDLSQHVK